MILCISPFLDKGSFHDKLFKFSSIPFAFVDDLDFDEVLDFALDFELCFELDFELHLDT